MKDYYDGIKMLAAAACAYGMALSKSGDVSQYPRQEQQKLTCGMCENFPRFGGTFCKLRKHAVNKSTPAGKCGFFKLKD